LLLFALLFVGLSMVSSQLHLFPRMPHARANGAAPELPAGASIGSEGLTFGLLVLATWAMSRAERRPFRVYGFGGRKPLRHFAAGILWGLVFLSALVLMLWQTHQLVFDGLLLPTPDALRWGLVWGLGFLVVALLEEFLLRGYIQYTLARGLTGLYRRVSPGRAPALGFWTAAILLSAVFGFGHHTNPGESPLGLLAAGLAGLVFALSLWRTGSLWWAIGFHASWDWAQSFLYGVADSGTMIQHHMLASHPVGAAIWSGGSTGPEGSVLVLPTMALLAMVIVVTLQRPDREEAPLFPTPLTSL
jgi:membrane protease YdiL (CAAX protease family)